MKYIFVNQNGSYTIGYNDGYVFGSHEIDVDVNSKDGMVCAEMVCLLPKLNVEHHIEVDFNLDEMDLTAAESKATYEEIKVYVKEQTGL